MLNGIHVKNKPEACSCYKKVRICSYWLNNPIVRYDQSGKVWGWLIGAAVGGVAGLIGQVVSDVVTSVIAGEVHISGWQTYVGAFVGGAAGGVALALTGNVETMNFVNMFYRH